MKNVYKEAGKRICCIRMARGYTREDLAELANISPKFLYEIENGRKGFSAFVLYNVSIALKVDCDYILTGNKKGNFDQQIVDILQLFDASQMEYIATILKDIYSLL